MNIVAVLKFDVTSVKRPLITMITNIRATCGTPVRNLNSSAIVSDKPESLFIKRKTLNYVV
jgi:hypothetical protein